MLIGYARTSTRNQKYSLEDQIEKLTLKGCEKIFSEEISSVSSNRPEFEKSLEFARDGDSGKKRMCRSAERAFMLFC